MQCGEIKGLDGYSKSKSNFAGKKSDCKECGKERSKQYYIDNAEQYKQYRKDNPEKTAIIKQKRRARKASLPDTLTTQQQEHLQEIQNRKCIISGATTNLHLEHFIPLSWGAGGTTWENCYYMEGSLNISKGNRNPFEWIKTQPESYQDNFYNKLVPMLAERNNMTVQEFTVYAYQCEKQYKEVSEPVLS